MGRGVLKGCPHHASSPQSCQAGLRSGMVMGVHNRTIEDRRSGKRLCFRGLEGTMKTRPIALAAMLAVMTSLSACGGSADRVYTLYRNSPLDSTMRIHMATFDASDGDKYNSENCQLTSDLFRAQPGVTARYWCEQGPYKP